jgi:adenylylsulfate kinase
MGYPVQVLDGDEIRQRLNFDLGFSKADRDESIMRIGSMVQPLVQEGVIVLVAAISPYRDARMRVRERVGSFLEVYVNASLETCIKRDPKGLYARALLGELRHFTGTEDPYEPPLAPDVECNTDQETCPESIAKVLAAIVETLQGSSAALSKA